MLLQGEVVKKLIFQCKILFFSTRTGLGGSFRPKSSQTYPPKEGQTLRDGIFWVTTSPGGRFYYILSLEGENMKPEIIKKREDEI